MAERAARTLSASDTRAPDLIVDSATGVEVALPIVAPGGRTVAFVIDWHIRLVLALAWYVIAAILYNGELSLRAPLEAEGVWFAAVLLPAFAIYLLYHPVLEIAMRGRTPGKRMTGIRIVTTDGAPPSVGALLLRNVFRLIDSFPGVYVVGLIATFVTPRHVRLGDLAAGTLLVYERTGAPVLTAAGALAGGRSGLDPAQLELLAELDARWDSLAPEARRRLALRLAERLAPERPWSTLQDGQLRGALRELRQSGTAAPAALEREPALRAALLRRVPLWEAARVRLARLSGARATNVAEAMLAVEDYRLLARDLATARRIMPGSRARELLESTYAHSHALVHRPAAHPGYALWSLFRDQIPQVVAEMRLHILWTGLLFVAAALAGWWLVQTYPDLVALFASPEMIATVERGDLWTDNILNIVPSSVLSVQLLTNNIVVSLFAFCAGFLFGLGTFYIVGLNGFMLGGVFAFTAHHGLARRLFEFVVAHGIVELSCIVLAGAAGAYVGEALVRPATHSRADAFQHAARRAGKLLIAIALLLVGCGFIEGYISPDPDVPLWARFVIGAGYFVFMVAMLRGWLAGRSRSLEPIPA